MFVRIENFRKTGMQMVGPYTHTVYSPGCDMKGKADKKALHAISAIQGQVLYNRYWQGGGGGGL